MPNSEDMRHQLLDYCYGVIGRARGGATADGVPVPEDILVEPYDSLFEQRVRNRLVDRGYTVVPQFPANGYSIDLVVTGAKGRLAIECDGDAWHGPDAYEADLARQRDLERCGWQFFRIRESAWYVDQHAVLARVWATLEELDIRPSSWLEGDLNDDETEPKDDRAEGKTDQVTVPAGIENVAEDGAGQTRGGVDGTMRTPHEPPVNRFSWQPEGIELRDSEDPEEETLGEPAMRLPAADRSRSGEEDSSTLPSIAERLHTETAVRQVRGELEAELDADLLRTERPDLGSKTTNRHIPTAPLSAYRQYVGTLPSALTSRRENVIDGLRAIVEIEGPVVGFRLHHCFVLNSGGRRVGKQIGRALNAALGEALRRGILISDNPLGAAGLKPRTYRLPGQPVYAVRQLGPRTLEQVPPLELAHVLSDTAATTGWDSTESLFRQTLHRLGRDRLSAPALATLNAVVDLAEALDEEQ